MPIVKFVKEKKEIEVPMGANLRNEAIKAGVNLNQGLNGVGAGVNRILNCAGKGVCGTCRVLITEGIENTNKLTMSEWVRFKTVLIPDPIPTLAYVGHEDEMRLACCTVVQGDITVASGPEMNLFGENFFS
ncbi:2Fe-2S iron-sulfur cluster binding domain protein [Anatilimnocola aggregata]|uniref:2Fe-2S iron-sulfur cluster binding domain protein n=1 Tax=Anatilimnocola aggregata TaxID=2528021 RepID=A0A517YNN2_9BACT|nr:2Fe-2S iron-sulfur cluster-binding protein [Anatilimnocola aggregata]QDU31816.1 2Fe-2S iron-sulfur cluster binding domain protein [Anatilimnocola aggregata]